MRFILTALACLLLFTACDARGVDPVLKIGLVAPFEGEQRGIGYDVIYATRLAVREINAAGGIDGYKLSLVAYDDSTYPSEAENVAEALIVDPAIIAVLGHWQDATNAAASPLYDSAEMPYVPLLANSTFDPAALPAEFAQAYQAITYQGGQPPSIYAGQAYDAMQLIFAAIDRAADNGKPTRATVSAQLDAVEVSGITGSFSLP